MTLYSQNGKSENFQANNNEKISVIVLVPPEYIATYKVTELLHGNLKTDTVSFIASDTIKNFYDCALLILSPKKYKQVSHFDDPPFLLEKIKCWIDKTAQECYEN